MARFRFRLGIGLFRCALVWAAAWASGVRADTGYPSIRVGRFGATVDARNRVVMPLRVDIVNPGPSVSAELSAHSPGEISGQRFVVRRALDLPEGARVRVAFPFYVDVPDGTASRSAISTILSLELSDGRRVRWDRHEILGRVHPAEGRAYALMDARGAGFNWIADEPEPGIAGGQRYVFTPLDFPRTASSLSFADSVIVGDVGAQSPDTAQQEALLEWVSSGGRAVFIPTPNRSSFPPRWEALLPGAWLRGDRVETLPRPGGGTAVLVDSGGIWRAPILLRDGTVWAGEPDDPLAAAVRYGRGWLVQLSFDAGSRVFQDWSEAPVFWTGLFDRAEPTGVPRGEDILRRSESTQDLLRRMAGARVASRRLIYLYLALVLGGIVFFLLGGRLWGRPERGWVLALLFAVGAGFVLLALTRRDVVERPSVVELVYARSDGEGNTADLEGGLGFFAPGDEEFEARLSDDRGFLVPGRTPVRPAPTFRAHWKDGRQVLGPLGVRARELRHAVGTAQIGFPPNPGGRLASGPDGLRLDLSVPASGDLEAPFIRWRRLSRPIPADVWDAQRALTLRPESRAEGFRGIGHSILGETDEMRRDFLDLLFGARDVLPAARFRQERVSLGEQDLKTPALYAFSIRPIWPLSDIAPVSDRHGLVLWRFPLSMEKTDGVQVWPRGTLSRRIRYAMSLGRESQDGSVAGESNAELVFVFRLPPESPPMVVDHIRLFFEAESEEGAVHAELLPGPTGPETPVSLSRGITRIEEAERFRDADGQFHVRVRIGRGSEPHGLLQRQAWIIHDMEIEVEGRPWAEPEEIWE